MAVTLSATAAITSLMPCFTNQPVSVVITVTNAGSTATNVTGIQLLANPVAQDPRVSAGVEAAVNVVSPVITIGSPVQVVDGSSLSFLGHYVYFSSVAAAPAAVNPILSIYAIVSTSDGSVTVTQPINSGCAVILQQQPQVIPVAGQLSFDSPLNSALFPIFF